MFPNNSIISFSDASLTLFKDLNLFRSLIFVLGPIPLISSNVDFVTVGRAAILHHDFPNKVLENQNFIPIDTPSPKEHLRKEGLSEKFIEYLKVFKGFVEE